MLYQLLYLLSLCTGVLSLTILVVMATFWLQSNTTREFFVRMNRLEHDWIILNWCSKLVRPLMPTHEPSIPSSRQAIIGNCTVHLARVPHRLTQDRINRETLCLLDLYYHEKRILQGLVPFGPKLITSVSEEAYLQTQLLMQSSSYLYMTFSKAIEEYLNYVRFTSDALYSYSPTSSYVYFSQER